MGILAGFFLGLPDAFPVFILEFDPVCYGAAKPYRQDSSRPVLCYLFSVIKRFYLPYYLFYFNFIEFIFFVQ